MQETLKKQLPCGHWPAVITADMVAGKTPRLGEPCIDQGRLFWLQTLPDEKGRVTIMIQPIAQQATPRSLLPRPISAKSKVHEYGGGSYCVKDNTLYFVLADDQQVYAVNLNAATFEPQRLTAFNTGFANEDSSSLRYADLLLDPRHHRIIAVCEQHFTHPKATEPVTRLVSIALDGSGTVDIIAEGNDFYASPTLSECGRYLCWLSWNHPNMPWDATQLYLAERTHNGDFDNARIISGAGDESLFQPQFSPNGDLFFVSDKNNWWNLYRINATDLNTTSPDISPIAPLEGEFATPQWTFKMSTYGFLNDHTLLATYTQNGRWHLVKIHLDNNSNKITAVEGSDALSVINGISCSENQGVFIGSSATRSPAVIHIAADNTLQTITDNSPPVKAQQLSTPQSICFPTGKNRCDKAYGFYYPPTHASVTCPQAPPLIVICHGGPTGATEGDLNLKIQFWTNRGFAVIDVNYRGSTGFGRHYRQRLHRHWGIYDVEDVCAAAEYAVQQGWANPDQLIIKGSSAGGYTVLAALTFSDTFNAGVSLYGIGDLDTLVRDTHKFEARYLDSLVGDYNTEKQSYYDRSPIHFVNQINCPLLVFQGLEDKVVPPNQAETMVNAVRNKGLEVRYITFPDEGHGFRNGHNIEAMLEQELCFYQQLFASE